MNTLTEGPRDTPGAVTEDQRWAARDAQWFDSVYTAHCRAVYAYAYRRQPTAADDICAEVFTIAWRRRHDVPRPPLPWLYGVAANLLKVTARHRAQQSGLIARLGRWRADVDDSLATSTVHRLDAAAQVGNAMAKLKPVDAEVLRLWAWEGLEPVDIARVLGISGDAARARLMRASRRVAKHLSHNTSEIEPRLERGISS